MPNFIPLNSVDSSPSYHQVTLIRDKAANLNAKNVKKFILIKSSVTSETECIGNSLLQWQTVLSDFYSKCKQINFQLFHYSFKMNETRQMLSPLVSSQGDVV